MPKKFNNLKPNYLIKLAVEKASWIYVIYLNIGTNEKLTETVT